MQALEAVLAAEGLVDRDDVAHHGGIGLGGDHFGSARNFLDRAEGFDHEHGMVRGDGASAFADQHRMRNFFFVADFLHGANDVAGVFVERIVDRAVEGGARSVVVDAESASNIEVAEFVTELLQFGVKPRSLAHGAFDRADVGNLRSDVEMDKLEAVGHALAAEQFARPDQFRGGQAELGVLAAARRPLAGTLGGEAHAHADPRFDIHLLGHGEDLREFLDFFHHHDQALAELATEHGIAHVIGVLVAIANDETFQVIVNGERGEQLGLAAGLEAEMEFRPGIDHFLHDFAKLVHFDREDAAVDVFVSGFGDSLGESAVDRLDAVTEQILETKGERKSQAALACFAHEFHHVDLARRIAIRPHRDVPLTVDGEIRGAPTLHIVERDSRGNVPIFHIWRAR